MATQLKLVGGEEEQPIEKKNPVTEVFEFWRVVMEKARAQLGPVRVRKIAEALRIGYTVDDLRLAIVGCKYDNWSQGQNDRNMVYDDIELICRNEVKIDQFMSLGELYMQKTEARAKREAEATSPGVPMPADVRARLDALFSRHLTKGKT